MFPRFVVRAFLLLAFVSLIFAQSAQAGVYISVRFAPPPLPIYVQPPCPEPNLIWVPGYWAYDYDAEQYYWVPGAWVPAPFEGALWTPPYWGWDDDDLYVFHPGYWGWHVGYYGGVNYGFGYMGVGFVGGEWHDRDFVYNTAVVNVNRTVIHNTYVNETIVHNTTVVNNHVSYEGGPGGIRHEPTFEERRALSEQHVPATRFQTQHIEQAKFERDNFFNANHGHPQTVALPRPLPAERQTPPPIASGARNLPGRNDRQRDFNHNDRIASGVGANAGNSHLNGVQPQRSIPEGRQLPEPRYGSPQQQRPIAQPRSFPEPRYNAPQQQRPIAEPRSFPEPRYSSPQQQRPIAQPHSFPEPPYNAPQHQRSIAEPRSFPEPRYNAPQAQRSIAHPRPFPEPRYNAPQQQRSIAEPRSFPEPRYNAPQPQRPIAQPRPFPEPRYNAPQQQRPVAEPRNQHHR